MIKNVTEITVLAQVMLGQPETKDRGVSLMLDLADQLLPLTSPVKAETPPAPPGKTPPTPPVKTPPPAPPVKAEMTATELNDVLVAEFHRLGSRDAIDAAMQALGATSVNDLDPSQYAALVTAVKAS